MPQPIHEHTSCGHATHPFVPQKVKLCPRLGEQQDRRLGPARVLFIVFVRIDADSDLSIGIGSYEARSPQPRHPAIALRPDDLYELPLPVKYLH